MRHNRKYILSKEFRKKWNQNTERKHESLSNLISAGPRYVFFLSLANQPQSVYRNLYQQGQDYVQGLAYELQFGYDNKNNQIFDRMQIYIQNLFNI